MIIFKNIQNSDDLFEDMDPIISLLKVHLLK